MIRNPQMPVNCSADKHHGETPRAEVQSRALGNSERIRLKYGSYGIHILESSPGIRVSSLYSLHEGEKVNRTFAVTAYPEVIEPAFQEEHNAIINGESIGIVFAKNGWLIEKHHLYFGEINIPRSHFSGSPGSDEAGKTRSAIHVYELIVEKDDSRYQYAFIAEVHHPEFLQLEDLAGIYGPEFDSHLQKKEKVGNFLDVIESRILAL